MGTGERREREKDRRRQEILDAARAIFFRNGFAATTMPAVARRILVDAVFPGR